LVWLGYIRENDVNHGYQHAVFLGVTGVLNDGDYVGSLFGHVDQVTAGAV
jgi:hypothetical protein